MSQRVCKRCLIRDLSEKDYRENIQKYIDALGKDSRVSDGTYETRLSICQKCDYLMNGTCQACGCYVEIRAAAKAGKCPKKKW